MVWLQLIKCFGCVYLFIISNAAIAVVQKNYQKRTTLHGVVQHMVEQQSPKGHLPI